MPCPLLNLDLRPDVIEVEGIAYIAEGSQLGYLREGVSTAIGWRE